MKIKLIFFFLIILFLFNISFANIEDKIIAKIGNEIVTNYDIVNEINTILALTNKSADKKNLQNYKILLFQVLRNVLLKNQKLKDIKLKNIIRLI